MSRKILVTGGAGYVGAHGCQALARAGWEVVVYDNLSRGWPDFVKWGRLIEGDLLDTDRLQRALCEVKPDAVMHFAALAYVGESVEDPARYYRNNTVGSLNLLEAMRAADVGRIVFSSTCATYGVPQRVPIDESHPQAPINPYGWSKLFIERMLRDLDAAHGLRSVALRYFNAAGADPAGEIGERHEPETHAIPLALRSTNDPDYRFTVFGRDYDTPDGTAIRDYIHVADLADAHLRAVDHLMQGRASEAINLGTGVGTSVQELIDAISAVTGRPLKWVDGPRRPGDPPALVADASKARRVLGWVPQRSDIGQILEDAARWAEKDGARAR